MRPKPFGSPRPFPPETTISASTMLTSSGAGWKSRILTLSGSPSMFTGFSTISPLFEGSRSASFITLYLTVAIWGLLSVVMMVAMMLPPYAGRVWSRSWVSGSMSKPVQSAVKPVSRQAATFGPRDRPMAVAPTRKMLGFTSSTSSFRSAE